MTFEVADAESRPTRVFVFGSCVGRDSVALGSEVESTLVGYVARQSLISAMGGMVKGVPSLAETLPSKFQRTMVEGDLAGNLTDELLRRRSEIDVLLWDLTDERFGVRSFRDAFFTPSAEANVGFSGSQLLVDSDLIDFGSDAHFGLFKDAAYRFSAFLKKNSLFESVLLLGIPHSGLVTDGNDSLLDRTLEARAAEGNRSFARYLKTLVVRTWVRHVGAASFRSVGR